jgi:hypothetical protein
VLLPLPGAGSLADVRLRVTPAGKPDIEKLIVELNPPITFVVSVAAGLPPKATEIVAGATLNENPGMFSVRLALRVMPPPLAVTVKA